MADAARTLLDLGADPTIRDHENRTPVELIGEGVKRYPGIPEVIRRIGALGAAQAVKGPGLRIVISGPFLSGGRRGPRAA